MTKEEVLSKIRKLFELANSPNENEAALAAAKARELLSRYNLSVADLPKEDMRTVLTATERSLTAGKVLRNWIKCLLVHLARGFECEHIIRRCYGCDPALIFIGTATDAEAAVFTFQFLYRELNRLVDDALPQLKRHSEGWSTASLRYAYLDGAVVRIGERFRQETDSIKSVERNTCKDLVLAKEQMIFSYMASAYPYLRKERGGRRAVSKDAYERGYSDADGISLPHEESRRRIA